MTYRELDYVINMLKEHKKIIKEVNIFEINENQNTKNLIFNFSKRKI